MSILTIDDDLYVINELGNPIKLTLRNWTNLLEDWMRMERQWVVIINRIIVSLNKHVKTPSMYGIKECAQGGDCMFGCIAEAFNSVQEKYKYTIQDIRNEAIKNISAENFEILKNEYITAKESNEISWDPSELKTYEDLQKLISEPGTVWGDYSILDLLRQSMNFNVIIFRDEQIYSKEERVPLRDKYKLYNTMFDFNRNYPTIFLYYIEDVHFQLIGCFFTDTKEIKVLFDYNEIPEEIKVLYKQDIGKEL